ncbi:DUF4837 family protein [Kordia zhangzhouensis]|uniref:DUF4837 family protein n=1 Tax=Kordia zhangzhouensis TaxID=1620405 RepID=UPI00062946EF|nr:DUF4837 family protein [Kordia zhangzhouensis]
MKKLYALILLVFVLFSACDDKENGKEEKYLPLSSGTVNMIAVVIDQDLWQGKVGDSIRNIYGAPTDGLPMEEPLFSLKQINPEVFKDPLTEFRSIMFVKKTASKRYEIDTDKFAKPQKIISIGGSEEEIISTLSEKAQETIHIFKNNELISKQQFIRGSLSKDQTLEETFGISLDIPSVYKMVKKEDNFVWYERKVANGTMNIIAYTMPLGSIPKNDTTIDAIIKMRDSIGKAYVPGKDPKTMYMITEKAYAPYLYNTTINNKPAFETKGMWEVYNFQMAGPFINYAVEDSENNRLMVIEGFTFAPSENKRDFMFEIEAILKTLKINK